MQVRSTVAATGVRLYLVDVSGGVGARRRASLIGMLASALPRATPVLAAGAGSAPDHRPSGVGPGDGSARVAPGYGAVRMAFVHHTENPNGYTPGEVPGMLLAIYAFHRNVNGWNDIGYNFVVDLYGRIFEARAGGIDEPVVGAHAGGYNVASTGVAVLGSFMGAPVSAAARSALERLLAWKLSLHGVPAVGRVTVRVNPAGAATAAIPRARVSRCRKSPGTATATRPSAPATLCIGELPAVRRNVRHLAGRPARATLVRRAHAWRTERPERPGSFGPRKLTRRGEHADGHRRVSRRDADRRRAGRDPAAGGVRKGEVVLEQTLAQVVTDANGAWSVPIAVSPRAGAGMWLRALCPGAQGVAGGGLRPAARVRRGAVTPASGPAPTPQVAPPPAQ